METSLIFDYIENIKGTEPKKVTHVEDLIETNPENPDIITCIYSLFSVDYSDVTESLFIQTASSTANIVLPASQEMLEELFPDYADKKQITDKSE